ncbi:MAG TPA: DHH family phosphoesterase, partial [Candidatus Xenobia bacterium]
MLEVRSKPRWVVAEDRSSQARILAAQAGIHPLTAQVLINRGVDTVEAVRRFLSPRTEVWHEGKAMLGMARAADLLADAMRQGRSVCVHGDYDCDGVSATALLVTFLRDQHQSPLWYIPHRIDEGYGISAEGVRWAAEQGAALLVTVDCGSSSPGEVALARELGLQVIVTD